MFGLNHARTFGPRASRPGIALTAFATFHGVATLASGGLLDGVPAGDLVATASEIFWRGLQPTSP
jgi:hypothetical protein